MNVIGTSILGLVVVVWALWETFQDLFQPSGSGSLSSFVGRRLFQIARRVRWMLPVAGPLSVVVVIACWAALVAAGFALIYWGRSPGAFSADATEPRDALGRFAAVLYFSLATLTTVGSGSLAPKTDWVRLMTAIESLIGISLVTASITWITLIYPALGRMRTLARRLSAFGKAQEQTGIPVVSGNTEALLGDFAQSIIRMRVDFIHFPLIYYFRAETEEASLPDSLGQLVSWAELASRENQPERVRLSGNILKIALLDLAKVLAVRFDSGIDAERSSGRLSSDGAGPLDPGET
jgi:hypothetical protein